MSKSAVTSIVSFVGGATFEEKIPTAPTDRQGCDRYKYFGSPNQIQNQIRLVLMVLPDTKICYH